MTMTPDRFRQLLDQSTADAPPAPTVATDVAAGHKRLRRRRLAAAAAAAAAVVVVAGAVGLGTRGSVDHRGVDPVVPAPSAPAVVPDPPTGWTDQRILSTCDSLPPGYFDGPERLMAATITAHQVRAAIASADDRYWAECTIPFGDPDLVATVIPYDSQGVQVNGYSSSLGPGCPGVDASGCRLYSLDTVDRLPPAVKAVQLDLSDGSVVTIPTTDGYYALNELRPLPDGASFDEHGRPLGFAGLDFIHQMTYLDAAGTPLAAVALDGSGTGEFGMDVEGLPPAGDAYPSLRGEF